MLVLGVDTSSKSCGLALVDGETMIDHAVWTPPKRSTRPAELADFDDSLDGWLFNLGVKPDFALVEELAVSRNFQVIRTLSHFEGVAYCVLARNGIPVRGLKAGEARNMVLGLKITATKEEVLAEVRRRYKDVKFPAINAGGGDVADAFVMGLAGPEVLRTKL